MRPTALVDVDGVLADFVTGYLRELTYYTGETYDPATILTWEVTDSLKHVNRRALDDAYARLKSSGGCKCLPVYEGAQEGIRRLKEVANVIIVTSPFTGAPTWTHEREEWLKTHFNIDNHHVIHAKEKHRIHGDALIDDKAGHVEAWEGHWGRYGQPGQKYLGLLWSTRRASDSERMRNTIVRNWDEVLEKVKQL